MKWLTHSASTDPCSTDTQRVAEYLSPDDARIPHYPPTGCEVIYEEEQNHDHA